MLVKIKFTATGEIKEVGAHLATKPELQKSMGFVILDEQGNETTTPMPVEEKKSVADVVDNPVADAIEPEIIEPKKRGRKPKK